MTTTDKKSDKELNCGPTFDMACSEICRAVKDLLLILSLTVYHITASLFWRIFPKRKKSLRGRLALVTGAGHGIGRNFALQLAEMGARVICWDINSDTVIQTVEEIKIKGGEAWAFKCDVSDPKEVARVASATR